MAFASNLVSSSSLSSSSSSSSSSDPSGASSGSLDTTTSTFSFPESFPESLDLPIPAFSFSWPLNTTTPASSLESLDLTTSAFSLPRNFSPNLLDLDDEEDTSPPSPSVEVEDEGYDLPAEQEEESTPSVPPVAANGEDVPMQAADEKQKAQDVALPLEYQQNCIYILDYYAVFASKDFINYEKKYIKNDGFFQPLLQMFRKEVKPITSHLQLSDLFKLTSFLVENPELLYSRVANSSAAFLFDKNVFNTINKCAIQLSYLEIIVARYNAFHGQTTQFLAKSLSSTLTAEHKGEQKGNPNDDQTSLKRKREETAAPEGTAPEDAPSANKKGRTEPHTVPTASAVDTDGDAKMTSAKPKP